MSVSVYDSIDDVVVGDRLTNLISGLGSDKDKATHGRFRQEWLDQSQLEAMYYGDWLAGTIVDAPADDMTREWRSWKGGKNQVAAIQRAERSLGVRQKVNRALKHAACYGGGAILIGDGSPDPSQPLDIDRIPKGGIQYLHNLSRNEIVSGPLCRDPMDPNFGEPEYYQLATPTQGSVEVHPSRVVRIVGLDQLEQSRDVDAWGQPVLQRVYEAVRNAAATSQGLASLVQEAKIDVIKVEGLTKNSVDAGWRKRMLERFALASTAKSINGMLLLDAEENYEQKKISLADLPKVLSAFLEVAAGAANMPVTRLLGRSPGGLGSNGDGELRHYYDTLSSRQETELRPALDRLDRALKRHATGSEPDGLDYEFVPLWQLTHAERAAVALQRAQAIQVLVATGTVPFLAMAKAVQSQLVADNDYPALEAALAEEIEAGRQVTAPPPPPTDGSQPKNPSTLSKEVHEPGDE